MFYIWDGFIDGKLGFAKIFVDILWTCNNLYGHFVDLQKSMWAFYGLAVQQSLWIEYPILIFAML